MKNTLEEKTKLDTPLFLSSIGFTAFIVFYTAFNPRKANKVIKIMYDWIIYKAGFLVLVAGLATLVFLVWLAFSRYGNIKFGGEETQPNFKLSTYIFMIITTGVSSSLLFWAMGEPMLFLSNPPMYADPNSIEASFWAVTYPLFHWGPIAWAIYCVPAIPFAYYIYNRKKRTLRVSDICSDAIGRKNARGLLGYFINILAIFGTLATIATGMGYCTNLIGAGLDYMFGIPHTLVTQLFIIFAIVGVYTFTAIAGLRKGIARLSDISVMAAIAIGIFTLVASDTSFILSYFVDSLGVLFQNFFRMSTWLDPIGGSSFPHQWTVYYWAWFFAFFILMGVFIAKISKGRTIKEVILTCVLGGSGGCAFFVGIFGSHTVKNQILGKLPIEAWASELGTAPAIIRIVDSLPLGGIILIIFLLIQFFMMSTSITSVTYGLSMMSTKNLPLNQEPSNRIKIAWALGVGGISMVSFFIGGTLESIKSLSVIAGFPMIFIMVIILISFRKWLKDDMEDATRDSRGNIIINYKEDYFKEGGGKWEKRK